MHCVWHTGSFAKRNTRGLVELFTTPDTNSKRGDTTRCTYGRAPEIYCRKDSGVLYHNEVPLRKLTLGIMESLERRCRSLESSTSACGNLWGACVSSVVDQNICHQSLCSRALVVLLLREFCNDVTIVFAASITYLPKVSSVPRCITPRMLI